MKSLAEMKLHCLDVLEEEQKRPMGADGRECVIEACKIALRVIDRALVKMNSFVERAQND